MSVGGKVVWALILLGYVAVAEKPAAESAACSPFTEAKRLIGTRQCIRGTVVKAARAGEGRTFLDFCEDYRVCPFAVVIFDEDLRHLGALDSLVGRTIEIRGKVKDYDGQAEIVLQNVGQLGGEIRKLPPVPREFDVEQQGKFSAGTFHAAKARKASHRKATLPTTVDMEQDPNE